MTLYIDSRAGSLQLAHHIDRKLVPSVKLGQFDADAEWLGNGPDGPMPIGVEYKSAITGDIFTSMTDGRLTGTQLPRMRQTYQRIYLLIEGAMRVTKDGIIEIPLHPWGTGARGAQMLWQPARGRGGEGWTAREYWNRLSSIEEFFGCRVVHTHNIYESTAWLVARYLYWQKPYWDHASYKQWDSADSQPGGDLLPTSQIRLVERWAREIAMVGPMRAKAAADFFVTPYALATASEKDWSFVKWTEKLKTKSGYRVRHFGEKSIARIMDQIRKL